jgi:hypothetical protein
LPYGAPIEALNPRSYGFVPSSWTEKIRPAGVQSRVSENIGSLLK